MPVQPISRSNVLRLLLWGLLVCCLQTWLLTLSLVSVEGEWVYLSVQSSGTTPQHGTLFKLSHLDIERDQTSHYNRFLRLFQHQETRDAEILIFNSGTETHLDMLYSDFRGGFDLYSSNKSIVLPWTSPHGATPLWIVTYGQDNVYMYVRYWQQQRNVREFFHSAMSFTSLDKKRQEAAMIPPQEMEYPHRRPFARRRQQQGKVTLCTQLTVDRLVRLEALATNFAGPISAVVYVGFRTGNIEQEMQQAIQAWETSDAMKKHVDLHLVIDNKHPWYATGQALSGHGLNPYPVNVLRQLAVTYANTEWILYLEADMITLPNAHDQILERWEAMMEHAQNKTAFVVPLYNMAVNDASNETIQGLTSKVPPNKKALRSIVESETKGFRRMGDIYTSHKDIDYKHWETMVSGEFLPVTQKEQYFEPYFLIRKSDMPPYEVLFWSMLNDKRQQVTDMVQCNFHFVHHPDLYAVHFDSPGLGDGWIVLNKKTWRVPWAIRMHELLTAESQRR